MPSRMRLRRLLVLCRYIQCEGQRFGEKIHEWALIHIIGAHGRLFRNRMNMFQRDSPWFQIRCFL